MSDDSVENPAVTNAKWWADVWETVEHWAFLGVVLTLAIEFAASHLLKAPRKIIDDARQLEVLQLSKDAAEATARAKEAELALANIRAPRVLFGDAQIRFSEKLRPFAGTKFDVAIAPGGIEPENFSAMVERALSSAGWTELDWQGASGALVMDRTPTHLPLAGSIPAASGISAVVHPSDPPELWNAPKRSLMRLPMNTSAPKHVMA